MFTLFDPFFTPTPGRSFWLCSCEMCYYIISLSANCGAWQIRKPHFHCMLRLSSTPLTWNGSFFGFPLANINGLHLTSGICWSITSSGGPSAQIHCWKVEWKHCRPLTVLRESPLAHRAGGVVSSATLWCRLSRILLMSVCLCRIDSSVTTILCCRCEDPIWISPMHGR